MKNEVVKTTSKDGLATPQSGFLLLFLNDKMVKIWVFDLAFSFSFFFSQMGLEMFETGLLMLKWLGVVGIVVLKC